MSIEQACIEAKQYLDTLKKAGDCIIFAYERGTEAPHKRTYALRRRIGEVIPAPEVQLELEQAELWQDQRFNSFCEFYRGTHTDFASYHCWDASITKAHTANFSYNILVRTGDHPVTAQEKEKYPALKKAQELPC